MTTQIQFELELPQTPLQVWEALATSAALRDWLMPNDFRPELGLRFRFWTAEGKAILCRVAELHAGQTLAYWWDDGESEEPSLVTWKLDPTDRGTRLRLEHTHFETLPITQLENTANWGAALGRFVPVVFMSAEEEQNPNRRLAGLRDRSEVTK